MNQVTNADIQTRLEYHMRNLSGMITDAVSFFTDIERQRDDVAPAGLHIPMSIHARDSRRGLIVKQYTLLKDTDSIVVARLHDRKLEPVSYEQVTAGTNCIAFPATGKTLKHVMGSLDDICIQLVTEPSNHVSLYTGFSEDTHAFLFAVIKADEHAMANAWDALSIKEKNNIIKESYSPQSFLSRDMIAPVICRYNK